MDPREFLRLAIELAVSGTAAGRRSATSRAYYAAYHVALELLRSLGVTLPRGSAGHEAVRARLHHSAMDRVIHAGALLRQLENARVRADYALRDPYAQEPAVVALRLSQAEEIIRILDAARADPAARERMTRAIQAWEAARGPH